jgi:clan AA aspartic protease (TIGR02281 family)
MRGRFAHGGVLLVPVRFLAQDVECLVDTAAAYTALSVELVALLGLPIDPQRMATIATAHGTLRTVPRITLHEVRIGGLQVHRVDALVLTLPPTFRSDGVVGMNVLRHFRMTLESDTAPLILRPPGPGRA